jgi:hypothetical protein
VWRGFELLGRRIRLQSLRSRGNQDRQSPSGCQVSDRQRLNDERRQEGDVPPDQPDHRDSHHDVEGVTQDRRKSFDEEREEDELQRIGDDRDDAGGADAGARQLPGQRSTSMTAA